MPYGPRHGNTQIMHTFNKTEAKYIIKMMVVATPTDLIEEKELALLEL